MIENIFLAFFIALCVSLIISGVCIYFLYKVVIERIDPQE